MNNTKSKPVPAKIGDTVLLHTEAGDVPVIVTAVAEDGAVAGQAFLHGTDRLFVENATQGDDVGQFSKRE